MAALGALLLPMLPGWAASHSLQVYRPWFWAEFLVLALVTRGRPVAFACGLALLWMADFLFSFAQVNLSSNYGEVVDLLSFIPYANAGWIMGGVTGLGALMAWGFLCVRVHRAGSVGRPMLLWSLLLLGVSLALPPLNGFEHDEGKLYGIRRAKLAGSWLLDSRYLQTSLGFYEEGYAPDVGTFRLIGPGQSAISRLPDQAKLPDKLLLVVVESWGHALDPAENLFWRDLWQSPALREVDAGAFASRTPTISAEFRELCGFIPQSLRIDDVPRSAECLPNRLHAQGWQTQAFHGASSKMYKRAEWYPLIGFQRSYFLPELLAGGGKLCANVPGTCDYSIADRVVQTLHQEGKQLTYWMTLNAHTPYKTSDLSAPDVMGQVCPRLKLKDARCVHAALLYDFMQSLRAALLSNPVPGLRVVLVGDHAPKFFDAASRDAIDEESVPYLILDVVDQVLAEAGH
jgi:hypothetical protein